MELKTADFFDNTEVNLEKVMKHLQEYPQHMELILDFVINTVKHFKEFEDKKEFEKMMYEHKIQELYAEYMKE